jgi:hypothetical protein
MIEGVFEVVVSDVGDVELDTVTSAVRDEARGSQSRRSLTRADQLDQPARRRHHPCLPDVREPRERRMAMMPRLVVAAAGSLDRERTGRR